MDVGAVIVEQLEADGSLRTFRMRPDSAKEMTVAFANEYADVRSGPFHFLNDEDEKIFREGFATCKIRKLTADRFRVVDGRYEFQTSWLGIPTAQSLLSYYALSLPEYAIPENVQFADPRLERPYRQTVIKDTERNRFILYLECRSSHGSFDFKLAVTFRINISEFSSASYGGRDADALPGNEKFYEYRLPQDQRVLVQQFFSDKPTPKRGSADSPPTWEKITAFAFGVIFVIVMLYLSLFVPNPTPTQWFTFRVVLALAAAGVGALLPGLIWVKAPPYVRAGGALALFVLVYWFNPPKIISGSSQLRVPSFGKPYHVVATLTAKGTNIDRQTVPHPLSRDTDKGPHSFYTESNSGPVNSHVDVCPVAESGWEIDPDPYPGFSNGMTDREHVTANGSNYWDVAKLPGGCLRLYCDGRNGSSNVYIANVFVREKRSVPTDSCHAPVTGEIVVGPGDEKQISLDASAATGSCVNASLLTRVEFKDEKGALVATKDVTPEKPETLFDGGLVLQLNSSGLLDIEYKSQ